MAPAVLSFWQLPAPGARRAFRVPGVRGFDSHTRATQARLHEAGLEVSGFRV